MRKWKNLYTEYLLNKMRNTKLLQRIDVEPVKGTTCSADPNDFIKFWAKIFDAPSCEEDFEYINFASLTEKKVLFC